MGALEFGELIFHFAVGGLDAEFLGALDQDVVIDQFVDDIQHQGQRLFLRLRRRGLLRLSLVPETIVVILLGFGAVDFLAVDHRPNVWRGLAGAAASRRRR